MISIAVSCRCSHPDYVGKGEPRKTGPSHQQSSLQSGAQPQRRKLLIFEGSLCGWQRPCVGQVMYIPAKEFDSVVLETMGLGKNVDLLSEAQKSNTCRIVEVADTFAESLLEQPRETAPVTALSYSLEHPQFQHANLVTVRTAAREEGQSV